MGEREKHLENVRRAAELRVAVARRVGIVEIRGEMAGMKPKTPEWWRAKHALDRLKEVDDAARRPSA